MSLATRPPAHSTHPLARLLAGGAGAPAALQELHGASSSSTPSAQDPEQSFLVVEADTRQRRCIDLAARDASFAIVGAPGSGKTQTLVNIIADFLGRGRSVLCVGRQPAAWKDALDLLTQAGLGDFCLPLKDDRATRESVLAELTRALKQKPALPAAPATDYARLRACAAELARFDEALERVREPLQRSAASALAELHSLADAQTAPLGLAVRKEDDNAVVLGEITPTWLEEARQAVQRLAQLWHLRTDKDLVWAGFKAERYTQQVREEVLALIEKVRPRLDRVAETAKAYADQIGAGGPIPWLMKVGEAVESMPAKTPADWLSAPDVAALENDLKLSTEQYQVLGQAREPLTARYGAGLWTLPEGTTASVDRAWHTAAPLLASGDDRGAGLLSHQQQLRGWAADTQKRIPGWIADARTVEKWLAVPVPAGAGADSSARTGHEAKTDPCVTGLRHLLRLANLCQTDNPPERTWVHDPAALDTARKLIVANRPAFTECRTRRAKLLEIYKETFFELDLERIATGYEGPYQSWLRFFNGQYRRDRRALARRSHAEMLPPTPAEDVAEGRAVLADEARLKAEGPQRQPVLGRYERGLETDLDAAERATRVAADGVDVAHKLGCHSLPARLLDNLCAGTPAPEKVRAAAKRLHDSLSAWLHATHELKSYLPMDSLPGTGYPLEESALSALNRFAHDLQTSLNHFGSLTDPVLAHAPAPPGDAVALVEDLK